MSRIQCLGKHDGTEAVAREVMGDAGAQNKAGGGRTPRTLPGMYRPLVHHDLAARYYAMGSDESRALIRR